MVGKITNPALNKNDSFVHIKNYFIALYLRIATKISSECLVIKWWRSPHLADHYCSCLETHELSASLLTCGWSAGWVPVSWEVGLVTDGTVWGVVAGIMGLTSQVLPNWTSKLFIFAHKSWVNPGFRILLDSEIV